MKTQTKTKVIFSDDHGVACSEMRYLPYSSDGNILVCKQSYYKEIAYRKGEIKKGRVFNLPPWNSLKIYSAN
jgi:hypothetical protein